MIYFLMVKIAFTVGREAIITIATFERCTFVVVSSPPCEIIYMIYVNLIADIYALMHFLSPMYEQNHEISLSY